MILAGDIGGTNARLGIFTEDASNPVTIRIEEYPSRNYTSLDQVIYEFLSKTPEPVRVFCFGVAGPVTNGVARPTNLPWVLDQAQLEAKFNVRVILINDLEANAYGVATLGLEDLATLQSGDPRNYGNGGVIAAGTGLGEAGLFWNGKTHLPWACEGGHCSFSPCNQEERELLEFLWKKWEHVSWERVLSGPGLFNIYQFFRDTGKGSEPSWLAEQIREGDPSAAISKAALQGQSELCEKTLNMFVSLYGSEAGNLALKTMALSGMYLGGGIAPRLIGKLKEGIFQRAFTAKGRLEKLLEGIPVHVIMNDRTGLRGAARCGALLSQ